MRASIITVSIITILFACKKGKRPDINVIDRHALVSRHKVILNAVDTLGGYR